MGIDFGQYYALIIGNDEYKTLPTLETAVADAKSVAELLRREYGFTVTVMTDASRGEILGKLSALRKTLGTTDNLLIYYAGHGTIDEDTNQGYWLPVDAEQDSPANWISNADITNAIEAMSARHVLVVADSCYSGTLVRGLVVVDHTGDYLQRLAKKKARTVLTSGGLEPVSDSGASGHSVFANAFLDALEENTSRVDGQSLFTHIREQVMLNAQQTPEYSNIRLAGHEGGDFIFIRR
jgi:uncharacterized caspase-like protein